MRLSTFNQFRVRDVNSKELNTNGEYVLYWMQAYRRLHYNHALDYAISLAEEVGKPLVIYEAIRMNYPWASPRLHQFILEGICDNSREAEKLGITYWAFVETPKNKDKELLFKLSEIAVSIVTYDFPCFIIPNHIKIVSERSNYKVYAVDSNSISPLSKYGDTASAARSIRTRIHGLFSESYNNRSNSIPKTKKLIPFKGKSPFPLFSCKNEDIQKSIEAIPFKNAILPSKGVKGGRKEGQRILKDFIKKKLTRYSEDRSNPASPDICATSSLSPYLHFGYISIDEIIEEVLNSYPTQSWSIEDLNFSQKGKREGFFHKNEYINSFLDELLTWRDIGYLMFFNKPEFNKNLTILPEWIQKNLKKHGGDKRQYIYTKEQFENCSTHDKLWNSAQKELMITGRMHNYMRMLWGKKVIEWSESYEEAFSILEEFNNKYAYDGRNPNSYSGILWCFGLFDRPWFPERPILGNLRYMSSDSTMRKFKMNEYLQYVSSLEGNKETLFD